MKEIQYVPKNLTFKYRIYPPNSCCDGKEYTCEMEEYHKNIFKCVSGHTYITIELKGDDFVVTHIDGENVEDRHIYAHTDIDGIREYAEGEPVGLSYRDKRPAIVARNEGGFNGTEVDLLDLIKWIKNEMPELLQ